MSTNFEDMWERRFGNLEHCHGVLLRAATEFPDLTAIAYQGLSSDEDCEVYFTDYHHLYSFFVEVKASQLVSYIYCIDYHYFISHWYADSIQT